MKFTLQASQRAAREKENDRIEGEERREEKAI